MIWQSEAMLYGIMIINMVAVAAALLVAWRRGWFAGIDDTSEVLFGGTPDNEEGPHE